MELGMINRGEHSEITTIKGDSVDSELSGNMIDICPVGALRHKPEAFHFRSWEFTKTNSVDVMDAVGSSIRVDARGREVMRIMPRLNEAVNEEWISDKSRYIADGLRLQRLDRPYVRENGKLRHAGWSEAFALIGERVKATNGKKIGAIAGDFASVEELYALKALMSSLGVSTTSTPKRNPSIRIIRKTPSSKRNGARAVSSTASPTARSKTPARSPANAWRRSTKRSTPRPSTSWSAR